MSNNKVKKIDTVLQHKSKKGGKNKNEQNLDRNRNRQEQTEEEKKIVFRCKQAQFKLDLRYAILFFNILYRCD